MASKKSNKTVAPVVAEVVDATVAEVLETTTVVEEVPVVLAEANSQLVENAEVITETVAHITKADLGRQIFNEALAAGNLVRKDVIARLINEAGLTPKGAATYFQNMKNKAGLVVHKEKAVEVAPAVEVGTEEEVVA